MTVLLALCIMAKMMINHDKKKMHACTLLLQVADRWVAEENVSYFYNAWLQCFSHTHCFHKVVNLVDKLNSYCLKMFKIS